MTEHACEREFEFSLILSGISDLNDEVQEALFNAGCDDATLSIQYGAPRLEFARMAPSFLEACLSAISDVCKAGFGVVQVDECNLVTQSEIAHRIDRSRQLVHQYITGVRGPGGFPPPACHIHDQPFWRWCEVSFWLASNDMIRLEVVEEAEAISVINNLLETLHYSGRNKQLMKKVAESLKETCGCGS